MKNEVKLILDSLEESIIIIDDNKIDFVNDMFLNQFKDPIYRIKSKLIQTNDDI
jgi:Holliday junction resolvase RusA-like endonuclease